MTEHIDVPLEVIDTLILRTLEGKNAEVLGGLQAIRTMMLDPEVRSLFEINSSALIRHQVNRILELENTQERFTHDVEQGELVPQFCANFREWSTESKKEYDERVKELFA